MTKTLLEKMGLPVVLYDLFAVEIRNNRANCKMEQIIHKKDLQSFYF